MDPVSELIEIYTTHSAAEIESDGALLLLHFRVATMDDLLAIKGYPEAFVLVSSCAALIDGIAARSAAMDDQMRGGVRLLRRMLDDGEPAAKCDATRKLLEGSLYRKWPDALQKLYDKKIEILEWRDFFVSYTNRDAPARNYQFRSLIKSSLGMVPRGESDRVNYLARVLTRHLRRRQGLTGFFDEDNLKVGETVQGEVDKYCGRAFALVQLIEPLTFEREPPRNWCFYEYSLFSDSPAIVQLLGSKDRHFFILTEAELQTLRPANLAASYSAWFDRIGRVRKTCLVNERDTTLHAKINEIATQILALKAEIVDAWIEA